MRLTNCSFPHPVVGNSDDVPGAEFQATFDFASDKTNFYLSAMVRCSSKTLLKMIKSGKACYTMHVECSNTLFRKSYDFTTDNHRITIPATLIHNAVEVNAFVRAKARVPEYAVDGAHEDYSDAVFSISSGDILAVGDGQMFDADHDIDPLRRVGSLMDVVQSEKDGDHAMEADFDGDKIHIILCKADYLAYGEMKVVPHLTNHLTTTLVLPVLIQALQRLEDQVEAESKWARILQARLENQNIAGQALNSLQKAQLLLDSPIRRALASAQAFLAASTN